MANQAISIDELFFEKYQLFSQTVHNPLLKNNPDAEDILQVTFVKKTNL